MVLRLKIKGIPVHIIELQRRPKKVTGREPHLDTGFLLLRESADMVSPLAVLYYEEYTDTATLESTLEINKEKIQCVIGSEANGLNCIPFGQAQYPEVRDYADGVDTLNFLQEL